jgi:MFS family permease
MPPGTGTDADAMRQPTGASRPGLLRGLTQPLRVHNYRLLFAGQLISGIGDGFYFVALPWLVLSSAGDPQALGLVLGAYGVTRALTTIAGGWLSDRIRPQRVMPVADVARMLLVVALAAAVVMGLCNGLSNVCFVTLVQRRLPRELMGRMMGAIAFGNFGLNPVSVIIAGFAAARYGPGAVIIAGGALSALVMLLAAIPHEIRAL